MPSQQRRNKRRHTQIAIIRRFWRKLSVISLPFAIFRRLKAPFTPFYMQSVMHACTDASKQAQTHSNRNNFSILSKIKRYFFPVWDISTCKRSFHCIMRAECSAWVFQRRNKLRHTQIAIIRRFCPKLCVISLQFEIFRRLHFLFTTFYVQNVVHALSIVEKSPGHTQIAIIRRFCRKLCVISLPFEIFRRWYALFTPFYMQNVVHAFSSVETNRDTRKSQSYVDFDENWALFLSRLRYFVV